jgi:uncharacterized protein YfcZ (UPF0381/DUF406 family)
MNWFRHLFLDHDKFNNVVSGIHLFILSVAIILGGIWTYYTFDILNQAGKAREELSEIQTRISNTESSSIKIETKLVNIENGTALIIEVKIKNNGKEKLLFDLRNYPLKVHKMLIENDSATSTKVFKPNYYSSFVIDNGTESDKRIPEQLILTGSEKILSYIVQLKEKGIYYVTFTARPIGLSVDNTDKQYRWFSSKYINLK